MPLVEGQRFDNLAKAMANGMSRRVLLRGLVGGVLGGALVATAIGRDPRAAAQAACTPGGPCESDADCCEGQCNTEQKFCYCSDPNVPGLGCSCDGSDSGSCGVTITGTAGMVCCPAASGGPDAGICTGGRDTSACSTGGTVECAAAGQTCSHGSDCCFGKCSDQGICYCDDPSKPALGCLCDPQAPRCGDLTCCPEASSGPGGVCREASACPAPPSSENSTTLPSTGSGPAGSRDDWVAATALLGAAGSALASRKLRQHAQAAE